jgi:trehalose 6-phosphate phosphatase
VLFKNSDSLNHIDLSRSAVLLDVDGTILDIAATPDAVVVPRHLCEALIALRERTGGATAFVSGRPLADLDRMFAPLKLPAVGGHGAELRTGEAGEPSRSASIDSDLRRQFAALAQKLDGVLLEDKGYSLALHYRLAPQYAVVLREAVAAACAPYPKNAIEVLLGKAVIEVKFAAFNKGTGIRQLMMVPPFRGRRPIFIGDDLTDDAAFAVLPEFGGIGISVGRRLSGLSGAFHRPDDVRQWLYRIAGVNGVQQS